MRYVMGLKGRPGMVLMPSKKNPRVKRWFQTMDEPFAEDLSKYKGKRAKIWGAYGWIVGIKPATYAATGEPKPGFYSIQFKTKLRRGRTTSEGVEAWQVKASDIHIVENPKAEQKEKPMAIDQKKEPYTRRPEVVASAVDLKYRAELRKYGYKSILGQKIKSPDNLADLCKIYRNPLFEQFRIFMLDDDNTCVGITALSSHRATETPSYHPEEDLEFFRKRMKEHGATKYYIEHNHPNGVVDESEADREFTADFAKRLPGFQGSLIIDHNKFTLLGKKGERVYQTEKPLEEYEEDFLDESGIPYVSADPDPLAKRKFKVHPALGTKVGQPVDIFNICRDYRLKKDGYYVLVTRKDMKVTSLVEIPKEFFKDREVAEQAVFKYALFGGGESFIWGAKAGDPIMKTLLIDDVVRDVITENGDSYYFKMDEKKIGSGRRIEPTVYLDEEYLKSLDKTLLYIPFN